MNGRGHAFNSSIVRMIMVLMRLILQLPADLSTKETQKHPFVTVIDNVYEMYFIQLKRSVILGATQDTLDEIIKYLNSSQLALWLGHTNEAKLLLLDAIDFLHLTHTQPAFNTMNGCKQLKSSFCYKTPNTPTQSLVE